MGVVATVAMSVGVEVADDCFGFQGVGQRRDDGYLVACCFQALR